MASICVVNGSCDWQHSKVVRHILTHPPSGVRVCAIVPDFSSVNLDPAIITDAQDGDSERDPMPLRLTNGSICFGLISSSDYIVSLVKVCQYGIFDVIVLEVPPSDDLLSVIESIQNVIEDESSSFPEPVSLDAVVSVVNAVSFSRDLRGTDFVQDRFTVEREDVLVQISPSLHVSEMLVEQIELSDIVVLEGTKQASSSQKDDCREMLTFLNPTVRITDGSDAYVDTSLLLQTRLFKGDDHAGWHKMMEGHFDIPVCKHIQHGIFQARRPFHPGRLHHLLRSANNGSNALKTSFRSMGYVWLATRNAMFGVWSSAGPFFKLDAGGVWYAAVPKSSWPQDHASIQAIQHDFCDNPEIGDRRQHFVFIGKQLDHLGIETELSECLLTDQEYLLGPEGWKKFQDPFEDWKPDETLLPVSTGRPVRDARTIDATVQKALDLKLKRTT